MNIKGRYISIVVAALIGAAITSCSSNDDAGVQNIEIPGITFEGDIDCCSAEEALQVYKFLQTVKIVPELSTVVDGKYNVFAYTKTGGFHVGYNEIYFVATKKSSGNYIKNFNITGITPLMFMEKMNMKHSTPASTSVESFNDSYLAVKRGWVSFVMGGNWTLSYDISVLGANSSLADAAVTAAALPEGQQWVKSFKKGDATYYLSLVNPLEYKTGTNTIRAYVSKKSSTGLTTYELAKEQFVIDIDPRMPDMGNHTSPDNTSLTLQNDGSYAGTVNLTMTGLWRIHLTVRDGNGNIVAGGDDLDEGLSSLYWDVTI